MVTTQDADLHAAKQTLLALGRQALTESYDALTKIGAAVISATPTVLAEIDRAAATRAIAMLPAEITVGGTTIQVREVAGSFVGLAQTEVATLNTEATNLVTKEVGAVLQRLHIAVWGVA